MAVGPGPMQVWPGWIGHPQETVPRSQQQGPPQAAGGSAGGTLAQCIHVHPGERNGPEHATLLPSPADPPGPQPTGRSSWRAWTSTWPPTTLTEISSGEKCFTSSSTEKYPGSAGTCAHRAWDSAPPAPVTQVTGPLSESPEPQPHTQTTGFLPSPLADTFWSSTS